MPESDRDHRSVGARLENAMKQLRLAREQVLEDGGDEDLRECITDGIAATDAALAIERGENDVLLPDGGSEDSEI